ncbi:MAG: hypothetical protein RBQ97_10465 [Acholeplasma sp.]|nr:hypothetical protein [Acholeplasma sp.]
MDLDEVDEFHIIKDEVNSASGMRKCFQSVKNPNVTHLMVLQDDVLPCKDLLKTSKKLIKLLPDQVISLFSIYDTDKPLSISKHWAVIDRLYGLCAYILPVDLVKEYLEFEKNIKDRIFADDVRLSMMLAHLKKKIYLTAPSLVEHICWDRSSQKDNKVPIENAIKFRIARNYIGFENSGLEIDWTKGLTDTPSIKIGQKHDYIRHFKKDSDIINN